MKNNITRVSVVTRTKDRPIFLKRALDSVGKQTYQDYIHLVFNDGGDRQEVEKVIDEAFGKGSDKVVVYHRETASGAPDSILNEAIDHIDSDYFAIHDDDDTWDKDFLKQTVEYLDNNEHMGATVVKTDRVDEKKLPSGEIKTIKKSRWMPDMKAVSLYRQCIDNQIHPISTLYRRSAYKKVGKFDSSLPVVGDWEFGIRLLMRYEVGFIESKDSLANYHHRVGGPDNSFLKHSSAHYLQVVANRYLREDLENGSLGVGYIISKLLYERDSKITLVKKVLPGPIRSIIKKKL